MWREREQVKMLKFSKVQTATAPLPHLQECGERIEALRDEFCGGVGEELRDRYGEERLDRAVHQLHRVQKRRTLLDTKGKGSVTVVVE
jgi:hypothetical protein